MLPRKKPRRRKRLQDLLLKNLEEEKERKLLKKEDLINLHMKRLGKRRWLEMHYSKHKEMRNLPLLRKQ